MFQDIYALIGIMSTFVLISIASFVLDKKRQGEKKNGI